MKSSDQSQYSVYFSIFRIVIVIVKEVTVFGDSVFSNGGGSHKIWIFGIDLAIRCHFHRYLG